MCIRDRDNIISAYQKLSEKYSLTYPEYWNSTEKEDVYKRQEIGYVYNSKVISPIIEDIKKKKYGSYLIGGVVGTGKSLSLIHI